MRIAQLRTSRFDQISQADFARKCGLHWVTMSNIENGKARVSLDTLERIADVLGVGRDEIRDEDAPLSADSSEDDEEEMVPVLMSAKHLRRLIRQEIEST